MITYWVIDTKCKVQPESTLPQDGSDYYYGRSVVPAQSKEQAITLLTDVLAEDHIAIEEILKIVSADDSDWPEDDEFEVLDSLAEAQESNSIALGCFISEKSL